jgi:hypothetical protein
MQRREVVVLVGLVVVAICAACNDKKSSTGAAATSGSGSTATRGSVVAQAASLIKDPCAILPTDLVKQHIPDAAAPKSGPEPSRCSMSNGKSVVEISMAAAFGEPTPPDPSEKVADLGEKAWVQEQLVDDAFVVVFLGVDDRGSYRTLDVEYAGHDGKGHKDDAITIARQIIANLRR